jgi:hypothetical protein
MTVRTFKQCGQGFGSEPIGIVAKINDIIVFEGTVPAIDEPLPVQPDNDDQFTTVLFSWENTVDFAGTESMEITVIGPGTLFLTDTIANYVVSKDNTPPPGPDVYKEFYNYTEDEIIISDPFIDPAVNGTAIVRNRHLGTAEQLTGQWWYTLYTGAIFTTTVNITAGTEPPAV